MGVRVPLLAVVWSALVVLTVRIDHSCENIHCLRQLSHYVILTAAGRWFNDTM